MSGDITQILREWAKDRHAAVEQLTPLVYSELHKIASGYMRNQRYNHTLQATELINEAYMRMVKQDNASFDDRTHFFALAAKIMRGILVDFARAHKSEKRAGGKLVQLEPGIDVSANGAHEFLALHDALDRLRDFDERKAAVLELRFFGGLGFEEISNVLGISLITAKRDAAFAEAWLRRDLSAQ